MELSRINLVCILTSSCRSTTSFSAPKF